MDLAAATAAGPARARAVAVRTTAGLVIGAALVLAFLRLVNVGAVYQRLQHLQIGIALLCGVAFLTAYVVRALRWRCLLRPCRVSVRRAVAIYQVAIFLNWLLPVRGGEIGMSLLLRHTDGIPVNQLAGRGEHGQGHGPAAGGRPARCPAVRPAPPERPALGAAALGTGRRRLRRRDPRPRGVAPGTGPDR